MRPKMGPKMRPKRAKMRPKSARGRRRGPRWDGLRGCWDGIGGYRGPGRPHAEAREGREEAQGSESYKHWDGYSVESWGPRHRPIGTSSSHPIDFEAEWGPRWVQVGCKWSQECKEGLFKNRHFAWEGCQKSRLQGTTWAQMGRT